MNAVRSKNDIWNGLRAEEQAGEQQRVGQRVARDQRREVLLRQTTAKLSIASNLGTRAAKMCSKMSGRLRADCGLGSKQAATRPAKKLVAKGRPTRLIGGLEKALQDYPIDSRARESELGEAGEEKVFLFQSEHHFLGNISAEPRLLQRSARVECLRTETKVDHGRVGDGSAGKKNLSFAVGA